MNLSEINNVNPEKVVVLKTRWLDGGNVPLSGLFRNEQWYLKYGSCGDMFTITYKGVTIQIEDATGEYKKILEESGKVRDYRNKRLVSVSDYYELKQTNELLMSGNLSPALS